MKHFFHVLLYSVLISSCDLNFQKRKEFWSIQIRKRSTSKFVLDRHLIYPNQAMF